MTDFNTAVTAKLSTLLVDNAYSADRHAVLAKSVAQRGKNLDIDSHALAMSALHLSDQYRDANAVKLALNSMPQMSRAKTLALWFDTFGNVKTSFDAKTKLFGCKMVKLEECADVDFAKALATPFWTKAETVPGIFDDTAFAAAVQALIKRAENTKAVLGSASLASLADIRVANVRLIPADAPVADPLTSELINA